MPPPPPPPRRQSAKQTTDGTAARRARTSTTVQIRKAKQADVLAKRRGTVASTLAPQANDTTPPPVPSDVESLTTLLNNPHIPTATLLPTLTALRKLTSLSSNPPISEMLERNILPALVNYLTSDNDRVCFECCWIMTNVSASTTDHTRAVATP